MRTAALRNRMIGSGMGNDVITIVSGLPRSGTSMMMRMLDEGGLPTITDEVRKADEDNPKGYYEFEPVKKTKQDASWVPTARGKAVKMVYALLYDLPAGFDYRVIFMRRRLEEVIESQDVMLQRRGKGGGQLSTEQLVRSFEAQLAKVYDWLAAQAHFKTIYIDYNEIMKDPAPSAAAINAFCGGTLDEGAMCAVVDPALYRRRR